MNRPDICLAVADLAEHCLSGIKIDKGKANCWSDTTGLTHGAHDFLAFGSEGGNASAWSRSAWAAGTSTTSSRSRGSRSIAAGAIEAVGCADPLRSRRAGSAI